MSIVVTNQAQHHQAVAEIARLAGCLEDSPEERQLIELMPAVVVWESKRPV